MLARIAAAVTTALVLTGCDFPPRRAAPAPPAGALPEVSPVGTDGAEFSSRHGPARVTAQGVFDYTFTAAPTDWRAASGIWRVAPRWDCDPRYTFFCGWPDQATGEKAVVIWNKRSFGGDVTIDLYVGPKDERRRGRRYEYMQDVNVTVATDGKDLTSGYTFTFGGFSNTRSAILRGSDILTESTEETAKIAGNMKIHHRWWHLRAEREGDKLTFAVECWGEKFVDLECVDPQPLTGDRVAIWSYDCGMVLARVRISGLPGNLAEGPDFEPPGRTRTYYDIVSR